MNRPRRPIGRAALALAACAVIAGAVLVANRATADRTRIPSCDHPVESSGNPCVARARAIEIA